MTHARISTPRRGGAMVKILVPLALIVAAGGIAAATVLGGPETREVTVPAVTVLVGNLEGSLSTESAAEGDAVQLRLSTPVAGPDGTVIPEGAVVHGTVSHVRDGGRIAGAPELTLTFASLEVAGETYAITAAPFRIRGKDDAGESAGMIAGGTAAGAIVGAVAGGDAGSAVAGAVVGGALGTGVAIATDGDHLVLPAGTALRVRMTAPVTMRLPVAEDTPDQS